MAAGLHEAREAYADGRWDRAHARFAALAADTELALEDLAAYADAAWWLGRTDESLSLSEEVYRRCLQGEQAPAAAQLAVEMGFLWLLRGEETIGSGWISRARRLLADGPECPEHGYLVYLDILGALDAERFEDAVTHAQGLQAIADRHDDATLRAIALVYTGVARVRLGEVDQGLASCDEAMLPVHAGAVTPNWAGNLYCQVMGLFFELADYQRARAWTEATERWCDRFSNAAMFTGICRVHRAQLLHLEGAWAQAEAHARQACQDLADMNLGVVAAAQYELGELARIRGDHSGAARAFDRARELGRDPQPGWALLKLAEGDVEVARRCLDAALAATVQPLARAPLLAARLELAEYTCDVDLAAATAAELRAIAATFDTTGLCARAHEATGVAALLRGEAQVALGMLRDAYRCWRELGARYETARTQLRLAAALELAGDRDTAAREQELAAAALVALGAAPQPVTRGAATAEPVPGGLSPREVEVLRAVAVGASNAAVARELVISERTVERHLSNVFRKLAVSSRTEAARIAFATGLVDPADRGA